MEKDKERESFKKRLGEVANSIIEIEKEFENKRKVEGNNKNETKGEKIDGR